MADFDPFDALRDAGRNAVVPEATAVRARGRQRQARQRMVYAALAVVVLVGGVTAGVAVAGGGSSVSVRTPATAPPTATAEPTPSESSGPEPTASETAAPDLRLTEADLDEVSVPGAVCGLDAPVQLHNGAAKVPDAARGYADPGGTTKLVSMKRYPVSDAQPVDYADLDGTRDAVMKIICDNNGHGSGDLETSLVVVSGKGGTAHQIGALVPISDSTAGAPGIDSVSVTDGTLTMHELFYQGNDAHCCPTGKAVSTWRWDGHAVALTEPRADSTITFTVDEITRTSLRYTAKVDGTVPQSYYHPASGVSGPEPAKYPQARSINVFVDGQIVGGSDGGQLACQADAALVTVHEDYSAGAQIKVALTPGHHTVTWEALYCAQNSTGIADHIVERDVDVA